jgi:hypothetical protein
MSSSMHGVELVRCLTLATRAIHASSLAEWLAQPFHRRNELLASTMIIDRQNGKD